MFATYLTNQRLLCRIKKKNTNKKQKDMNYEQAPLENKTRTTPGGLIILSL